MNIKIEKEKKVYVAPFMDIVNMDRGFILCGSNGGEDEEEGYDGLSNKKGVFEFN
jgi:hypothetical protein